MGVFDFTIFKPFYDRFKEDGAILIDKTDEDHEGLALVLNRENDEYMLADFYDCGTECHLYYIEDVLNIIKGV